MSQEAQIVHAVFPNPIQVLQVFLQRVFAQLVRNIPVRQLRLTHIALDPETHRDAP